MAEQIVNGILSTLAAAIASAGQTTGIQITAIPAAVTGTMRLIFAGNGGEIVTFTGTTGTGPYTLTGVVRGAEGTTAATYVNGTSVGVGAATAAALQSAFITSATGGIISSPADGASGQSPLIITNDSTYISSSNVWSQIPHSGSIHIIASNQYPAVYLDTFDQTGTNSYRSIVNLRCALGTPESPTRTVSGHELGRVSARGFHDDGTANFTGSLAAISFNVEEDTTVTNQGCSIVFRTTALGTTGGGTTTTPPAIGKFHPSGGLSLFASNTPPTDPGNGSANFSGSLTLGGNLILTGGVTGVATNSNAAAGQIGEYVTASLASGSAITLAAATPANIISISLTAGDWDVSGVIDATEAGGTTNLAIKGGVSATSATFVNQDTYVIASMLAALTLTYTFSTPNVRLSLAATTTVYLVANMINTPAGTVTAYGSIKARRMR